MRIGVGWILATALASVSAAEAPRVSFPKAVRVDRLAGATRVDVTLPGALRGYAFPKHRDGSRDLFLLVGPDRPREGAEPSRSCDANGSEPLDEELAGPARLVRLALDASKRLELTRDGLPEATRALDSADVNGDGQEDLLVLSRGAIEGLIATTEPPGFAATPFRIDATTVDLYAMVPRILRDPFSSSDPFWRVTMLGNFRTYGPSERGGAFELLSEVPLPVVASRNPGGLIVSSPSVVTLGRGPDGNLLLAAGPEAAGKSRLQTWLLSPEGPVLDRSRECWAKLPGEERVLDHAFLMLDARPVLAVTTTPSEKLGIFAEKLLRVFPLGSDRTRSGAAPLFAAETRANLWQTVDFHSTDVNQDGRQDLVLSYWKGLRRGIASLDLYLRLSDGSFEASPKRIEFPVEKGDRSSLQYGDDLDGDGVADLMLLDGKKLLIFAGRSDRRGKAIVAEQPTLEAALPEDLSNEEVVATIGIGTEGVFSSIAAGEIGIPRAIDLDRDGRREVILAGNTLDGRGRVVVFLFDPWGARR